MPYRPSFSRLLLGTLIFLPACSSTPAPPPQAPAEQNQAADVPSPTPPPAPVAFDDTITLTNGHVRLGVAPSAGRIVHFGPQPQAAGASAPSPENLLWLPDTSIYDNPTPGRNGQNYFNLGGDKLWPTVQALWDRALVAPGQGAAGPWPPDGIIDGQPWRVIQNGPRKIAIESRISPHLDIQARREIELAPDAPVVTITNTITRVRPNPFPIHIWTITQVSTPQAVLLGVAADRVDPSTVWITFADLAKARGHVRALPGDSAVALTPTHPADLKVGSFGRWVAAVTDAHLFVQSTDYDPRAAYPDNSNVQVYSNPGLGYAELELISEFVHLQPGQSLKNTVTWRLLPRPRDASINNLAILIEKSLNPPAQ